MDKVRIPGRLYLLETNRGGLHLRRGNVPEAVGDTLFVPFYYRLPTAPVGAV